MTEYFINKIPAALLLEVTEIATVYSAKLMKGKDVVTLTSTSGTTKNITKAEFIAQRFCNINGKEIRLISMKSNTDYMVYHILNRHCFAVKIPRGNKCVIHLANGMDLTMGKTLVIEDKRIVRNEDNTFDLSAGHVMSEAIFRKTCILRSVSPELLAQIQNRPVAEIEQQSAAEQIPFEPISYTPTQQAQPAQQTQPMQATPITHMAPGVQQPMKPQAQQKQATVKGVVLAQGKDELNNLICYFVSFGNSGVYRFTEKELISFCDKGLIENATAVRTSTSTFLRGINCSLSELPVRYV